MIAYSLSRISVCGIFALCLGAALCHIKLWIRAHIHMVLQTWSPWVAVPQGTGLQQNGETRWVQSQARNAPGGSSQDTAWDWGGPGSNSKYQLQ